ncbi:sugar phosphate nucleotidyltransferase [Candidatus Margulisiibacteriota bacterium]
MKKKKVFVLAGGMGTRLYPLTVNIPKPLIPVTNMPILELIINQVLKKHGYTDITFILYHQAELIKKYFGSGKRYGVNIEHVIAPKNLGTAGALKYAAKKQDSPFLVFSGDVLTNFNLDSMLDFHLEKKAMATVALTKISDPMAYGIARLDKKKRINTFLEKPDWSEVFSDLVNAGIYILDPAILNLIPEDKKFDFSRDLFPLMLRKKADLYGWKASGFWKDIGSINEYFAIHALMLAGHGFKIDSSAKVGSAIIDGDGLIGEKTIIENGSTIDSSIIGANCRIGSESYIKNSIIWDGVNIDNNVRIENSIIGYNSILGEEVNLEKGVVVGDNVEIGDYAVLRSNVKIWSGVAVPGGMVAQRDVIPAMEKIDENIIRVS